MNKRENLATRQNEGFVPIPNAVLDELLPTLRDTELRIVLILLRQTVGRRWRDSQGRMRCKERDWLSHSQLVRKTGRGSEAVSGAITSLTGRGLVVTEDEAGNTLGTPAQRRRHLGHLYFRYEYVPCGKVVDKPSGNAIRQNRKQQHSQ